MCHLGQRKRVRGQPKQLFRHQVHLNEGGEQGRYRWRVNTAYRYTTESKPVNLLKGAFCLELHRLVDVQEGSVFWYFFYCGVDDEKNDNEEKSQCNLQTRIEGEIRVPPSRPPSSLQSRRSL